MAAVKNERNHYSFTDVIENQKLPILLQSTNNCILGDKTVIQKDQVLTVLDRDSIELISCRDSSEKRFRLAKEMVLHCPTDYIEEFYPRTSQELEDLLPKVTCIQTKGIYEDKFFPFCIHEIFEFHTYLDETTVVLRTKDKDLVCISAEALLNSELFVLLNVTKTIRLEEFLANFDSKQQLRLRDPITGRALVRNFFVESVGLFDVAYTVTSINQGSQLKYETIPLDRRITFWRANQKIPTHVEVFGVYNSECYRAKMKEIKQLMKYELHSPRYYGCLVIENQYRTNLERPNKLNLVAGAGAGAEKSKGVRDSLRRGFNMIKKRTPSKEDLRAIGIDKPQAVSPPKQPTKKSSESSPKLGERTSSEPLRQKTVRKADANPLYDIDTLKMKQLKEELANNKNNGSTPSSRRRILPRPKSLDFDHSIFYYEKPFSEKSPHGIRHISDEQINQRIQSNPIQMPQPNRLSRQPLSLSSSPLGGNMFNSFEAGRDSGVDSPEESRSLGQILERFHSAGVSPVKQPQKDPPPRFRSQSAMEQRKSLSSSDLNISLPFNFVHVEGRSQRENLYAIPSKKDNLVSQNFSELDGSMSFPELENMSLVHSKNTKQPAHYAQPRSGSEGVDIKGHLYESVIYAEIKDNKDSKPILQNSNELKSMKEIKLYNMSQVREILENLGLSKHIKMFRNHMVNGYMLVEKLCENQKLFKEMGLSDFEARKLYKYVHGWRPIYERNGSSLDLRVEEMDRIKWSVKDVVEQMKRINLASFGDFCGEHFIDGALLMDLVQMKILLSLKDHGMELKNIEIVRLESVVVDKVQYHQQDLDYMTETDANK